MGNRPNICMITLYKSLQSKVQRYAHTYCIAYTALQVLDPGGCWSSRLQVLHDKDIHGPGKDPDDPTQNSHYEPSWIWLVARNQSSESTVIEEDFNDSMRVEWVKAQARVERWSEELLIVQEEMRRVLVYLRWKSDWWVDQGSKRVIDHDLALVDGIQAYAHKQAAIQTRVAERCAAHWLPVLLQYGITPSWESDFDDCTTLPSQPGLNMDASDDEEDENESELDDEEDIVNSLACEE